MVEEKGEEGAGPEEFVIQVNVEATTDETSLRILNHQVSKHDGDCARGHDGDKVARPQVEEHLAGETPLRWFRENVETQRGRENHVQSCTADSFTYFSFDQKFK